MGNTTAQRRKIGTGGWVLIFCMVLTVAMFIGAHWPHGSSKPDASDLRSEQDVKSFIAGTWTYADPVTDGQWSEWEKWVVRDDATLDDYSARPVDNDWGKPTSVQYEVFTGKFTDTGKRLFGIRLKGQAVKAVIIDNDTMALMIGDEKPVRLIRGDKNPFSK